MLSNCDCTYLSLACAEVVAVVAFLFIVGLYEFRGRNDPKEDDMVRELRKQALNRDASARARMQEVNSMTGAEVSRRADAPQHMLPENGDQHPALRIAEGGIPDGYFPIDLNTQMEDPEVQLCRLDIAVSAIPSPLIHSFISLNH